MPASPPDKAGQRLAQRIERDILATPFRPGDRLGSETELLERYQTSRTLFREAVRLLEHDGICEMRRGPGGGLHVIEMDSDAVSHAAALWLQFTGSPVDHLYEVRHLLECRCAAWAAERIDAERAARLKDCRRREDEAASAGDMAAFQEASNDFHIAVAEAAGNRVATLFVEVLSELNQWYAGSMHYSAQEFAAVRRAHGAIAAAILQGDTVLAAHRAMLHMRASGDFARVRHAHGQAARAMANGQ